MYLFFSGEGEHTFRFFKQLKRSCILNYLEFLEASVVSFVTVVSVQSLYQDWLASLC